ncbi:hypothetical protein [Fervidibacillus albus]|uniref:Uncharacterized protein n=1 Tax=Fervidibacillus albus TaxID=2980026 RepID=A0A9E8LSP3_9BACI|nr:hypothetical protein [Fervidibacillus albus]WAA08878.1 hypothetical protein OE104_09690 [Fervidibacillus albus]
MNGKWLALFIVSYIVAISLNFFPSMKFPDVSVNGFHFLATSIFLIGLSIYILKGIKSVRDIHRLRLFSLVGVLSGFIIYVFHIVERFGAGSFSGDIIAFFQYPFYFIFTTPMFGGNFLFQVDYGMYALFTSFIYLIFFLWVRTKMEY